MSGGDDWLSGLASKVGTIGSFIAKSLIPAYGLYDQWKDPNVGASNVLAGTGASVGVAGNVQAFCALRNVNVTFVGAQAGSILPIRTTLIVSGGTTATSLVAIR